MKLGVIDTILFAILVIIIAIQFYWDWKDRQAGIKGTTKGLL